MDDELESLVAKNEGYRLDFKRTEKLEDTDDLARHLVAFANREGGKLVFGITDSQELQEESIDIEFALNQLANTALTKCDPPVAFKEQYKPNQEWRGKTGDILIVDVEPYHSTPHARTEGMDGATRTYFVRTADGSRPITNSEEIQQLFSGSIDPSFSYNCQYHVVHEMYTYEPVQLHPRPDIWWHYEDVFEKLTESDRDLLMDDETREENGHVVARARPVSEEVLGDRLIREVAPLLIFRSLQHMPSTYWFQDELKTQDEADQYLQRSDLMTVDDLEFENDPSLIPELGFEVNDLLEDWWVECYAPRGTRVSIKFPNEENESAELLFEVGEYLDLEVSIQRSMGVNVMGIPLSYPASIPDGVSPSSEGLRIEISAKFGFPDIEDPSIRLYKLFANGIRDFVDEKWNWSTFVDQLPHQEVYKIRDRLNTVDRKIDRILDERTEK